MDDLFGQAHTTDDGVAGLPLITNSAGETLVFVPGHIYKPNPLDIERIGRAGPGALINTERQFLAGLIEHLGAHKDVSPDQIPAAIKCGQTEYYLLRNIDRSPGAARFRVGYGNWFYPDFIFWIVDHATEPQTQRLCYIDPKGLEMGARGGWGNHKLLCFIYKLVEIGQRFPCATVKGDASDVDTQVALRFKGVIVSTSKYAEIKANPATSADYGIHDDNGNRRFPSKEEFGRAGLFFAEDPKHIEQMMDWLQRDDSILELVMAKAAAANGQPHDRMPEDEIGAFFLYLLRRNAENINSALAELVRHALSAKSLEQVVERLQLSARKELMPYLSQSKGIKGSLLGVINDPALIPDPCRKLYRCLLEAKL
jgi:hypothetical protein